MTVNSIEKAYLFARKCKVSKKILWMEVRGHDEGRLVGGDGGGRGQERGVSVCGCEGDVMAGGEAGSEGRGEGLRELTRRESVRR